MARKIGIIIAGTHEGGKKTAFKSKLLYGEDYYKEIGSKGGQNSKSGGFKDKARASYWGKVNAAKRWGGKHGKV